MSPLAWTGFLVAAAAGALLRAAVGDAFPERPPWGTVVINGSGTLVLGLIAGLVRFHGVSPTVMTVLGTGFCGAYTTFSTFTYETVRLAEDGELTAAAVNVGATLLLGIAAATAGLALAAL